MIRMLVCLLVIAAAHASVHARGHWPQWRGPEANGVSPNAGTPASWGPDENIVWKAELPSWSGGTPVIWGDRIFVTSPSPAANEDEQRSGGQKLFLLCLSREDGSELWRVLLDEGNWLSRKHNNTSPSPVTDGKHVWAVTGTGQVAGLTVEGEVVWSRNLQEDYGDFGLMFGYASSPLHVAGKLILQVLHGMHTDDPSYVLALDGETGENLWRHERATDAENESPDSYTTPAVLEHGGQVQVVITGGDYVTGHDLETGAEVWRIGGLNPEKRGNYRIVGSPLVVDGMIYTPTRKRPLLAIEVSDAGVSSDSVVWKWEGPGAPDVPTPACDGARFYMVDDRGLVTCLDAATGEVVWGPERTAQGVVSSSPVLADGKLYILNEKAVTTVVSAGPEYELLSTNALDSTYTISSPAVADSQLFIRTATHLYCIGQTE